MVKINIYLWDFDEHYLMYLTYDMLKKEEGSQNYKEPVEFNKVCINGENIPMRDPILQTKLFIAFGGMVDTARSLKYLKDLLKSKPKTINPID